FWDEDRKVGFEAWLKKLEGVTFHAKLGAMAQRVERIAALAREIAPLVGAEPDQAEAAARLAKADLASGMVGEFPELQGVMGGYYARAAGEPDAIADAIRDHYRPQGPGDVVPRSEEHTSELQSRENLVCRLLPPPRVSLFPYTTLFRSEPDQAEAAARLAKADLASGMVGEFPELQGVMGGYYARAAGEPDAIADAIRDHYRPQGPGDVVP